MKRWFAKLIELKVKHEYYKDGYSKDFRFVPAYNTSEILRKYRLLYKEEEGKSYIVFEAKDDSRTPQFPFDQENQLLFYVFLNNPAVNIFSDLPSRSSTDQILFADDTTDVENMELSYQNLGSKKGEWKVSSGASEVTLHVLDENNSLVTSVSLNGYAGDFVGFYDLSKYDDGFYTFNQLDDGVLSATKKVFLSEEVVRVRPFAIVRLNFDETHDYSSEVASAISIDAGESVWQYHLKLSKDYTGYTISIQDEENYGDAEISPYTKIDFVKHGGDADHDKGNTLVFQSGTLAGPVFTPQQVPYRQEPKRKVELTLTNGIETITTELPNPEAGALSSEVHLYV